MRVLFDELPRVVRERLAELSQVQEDGRIIATSGRWPSRARKIAWITSLTVSAIAFAIFFQYLIAERAKRWH